METNTDAKPVRAGTKVQTGKQTEKEETPKVKPEVDFSEEEQRIYDLYLAGVRLKVPPPKTERNREYCALLAAHVDTQDDMKSLVAHTRQWLEAHHCASTLPYLGNLANANVLNSWQKPGQEEQEDDYMAPFYRAQETQRKQRPSIFDWDELQKRSDYCARIVAEEDAARAAAKAAQGVAV